MEVPLLVVSVQRPPSLAAGDAAMQIPLAEYWPALPCPSPPGQALPLIALPLPSPPFPPPSLAAGNAALDLGCNDLRVLHRRAGDVHDVAHV